MDEYSRQLRLGQSDDINLLKMIESRIMEIVQIETECKKKLPKLFSQRLPRFMRRRAACHDPSRLPKRLRLMVGSSSGQPVNKKARSKLLRYKRKLLFKKRKRKLRRRTVNDPNRTLLHKWFAKRFKMGKVEPYLHVPIHNNTKNQRNLRRQLRYGCAYISMAHLNLIEVHVDVSNKKAQPSHLTLVKQHLNKLTDETSGFTFCAQAIYNERYEVCVHLYEPTSLEEVPERTRKYLGPALVSLKNTQLHKKDIAKLRIWVHRSIVDHVMQQIELILIDLKEKCTISARKAPPRELVRVRMIGQNVHDDLNKIITNQDLHKAAIEDSERRLPKQLGTSIGRCYKDTIFTNLIYYNTHPRCVDIVFRRREGKLLWHKLIKNKAHLVGGYRDVERLMTGDCFELEPDTLK